MPRANSVWLRKYHRVRSASRQNARIDDTRPQQQQLHSVGPTLRSSPRTTFCLLTTCEQAHYISPHELVASSMAGKSARKSQRRRGQSRDIKTGQATHLWDPDSESAVGEHGSDASLPSSACIAFSRLAPFHKTGTDFDRGNYLNFCTSVFPLFLLDLQGLVLKPQSLPHRVNLDVLQSKHCVGIALFLLTQG